MIEFDRSVCLPEKMKRLLSYRYARFPVAAVLGFAVLTKVYQAAAEPSDGVPWLAMGHVLFESGLALLLLSGVWPQWTKWTTIAVFMVFFGVAADLALKSADSCGCFGNVQVDPQITALLDAIIAVLLLCSPTKNMPKKPTRKQTVLLAVGGVLSLLLLIPMLFHPPVVRVEHETPVTEITEQPVASGLFPETVDLGCVEPKSVHRFTLELFNGSDRDWPIESIETECTCIAAVDKPESVVAEGKTSIGFEFTAPNLTGPYVKTISVTAGNKVWETRMRARIAIPLDVEPESLTFSLKAGVEKQPLTIRNDGPAPVRLLYATASPPICMVKIRPEPIHPGENLALSVVLLEPKVGQSAVLQISTNHKHQKTLRIQINIVE